MAQAGDASDYAVRTAPALTTTPPAAKISREIGQTVVVVCVIVAATVALIAGKMDPSVFAVLLSTLIGGYFGRSKPEGVVGEQTLLNLLGRDR